MTRPADGRSAAENPTPGINRLTAGMRGRWLVTTQGSRHEWDLDAMTYMRIPGPGTQSGQFPHDHQRMTITQVVRWPRVGTTSLVFYDDPSDPQRIRLWRRSSRITSITELGEKDSNVKPDR
ncbi:hypothetical protein PT015_10170 [Candidatus Mycobacterium wuenschmannii]|uniref:Uncharacterized protein n=1 Tax=Candidatus Mycobacterium wuenschmannii TaxID=3027808 RepID=A0ABY8W5N1_9MYCO|nr:hypothetical protein [Candidatus Mycobacterium wuenschmannii]WIM89752.1 hypothetical protein PT015_10170 [Candidatus Mycobacterium wuenschmannii]